MKSLIGAKYMYAKNARFDGRAHESEKLKRKKIDRNLDSRLVKLQNLMNLSSSRVSAHDVKKVHTKEEFKFKNK